MGACPFLGSLTQAPLWAVFFLSCFLSADPRKTTASSSSFQTTQSYYLIFRATNQVMVVCFHDLDVSKTKETVIDFRTSNVDPKPSTIHGEVVQIIQTYKYLGIVIDSQLKFSKNTDSIIK